MAEDLKELTRRYIDQVWNKGKLELVDQLVAPGCRTHDPAAPGGELAGPEGVKQLVAMYRSAFPDTEFDFKDLIQEGDKVAARITATGTHHGTLMGIAPTGKRVSIGGIVITQFRDGKQVESWSSYDQLGMLQQLGAVPALQPASRP
jgi:steroid delta-isomerase-like uncharacterized protein